MNEVFQIQETGKSVSPLWERDIRNLTEFCREDSDICRDTYENIRQEEDKEKYLPDSITGEGLKEWIFSSYDLHRVVELVEELESIKRWESINNTTEVDILLKAEYQELKDIPLDTLIDIEYEAKKRILEEIRDRWIIWELAKWTVSYMSLPRIIGGIFSMDENSNGSSWVDKVSETLWKVIIILKTTYWVYEEIDIYNEAIRLLEEEKEQEKEK